MKRILLPLLLILFILTGCAQKLDGDGMIGKTTYIQIDQEKAKEMMAVNDGHVIVDVRRADEYAAGHIPGAILIPNESIYRLGGIGVMAAILALAYAIIRKRA